MNNLSHYRIGSTILVCPKDKTSPVIEVFIIGKAQGRGQHKSLVKVEAQRPLDIFGDKHKSSTGTFIIQSTTAWLSPDEWEVVGKVDKPKEAGHEQKDI